MLMQKINLIKIDFKWSNPKFMGVNEKDYLINIDFTESNPKLMDVSENNLLD